MIDTTDGLDFQGFCEIRPRPDQPDRYDEQESFFYSQAPGVSLLVGGNGCIGAEQPLYDPVDGTTKTAIEREGLPFYVWSRNPQTDETEIGWTPGVFQKGTDALYRVTLSNGESFVATLDHRTFTPGAGVRGVWREIREWYARDDDGPEVFTSEGKTVSVTDIQYRCRDTFYDLTVYPHHNYEAAGVWHHNSGTTTLSLLKAAWFMLQWQPPPRKDTPFWILSDDLEACMETAWAEKLDGMRLVPSDEVDWDRIHWYKVNNNWPFRVPLKPWPDRPGKNWTLTFKSYESGRRKLQARSIGGFLFIEQAPYPLVQEVLRGCRDYNYPGSKMMEFTPVDPDLSIDIEEMEQNDKLPPGWEIWHANTECAVEAGHVERSWFEEFFATVPEEMRETRMTGKWATYEGAVYQLYNKAVHEVGDDIIDFPPDVDHFRAIDWGNSPGHPFVTLFGYRNSYGQWFIYDEYRNANRTKTTVDKLKDVVDRWPWPKLRSNYGPTFADPSEPGDIQIGMKLSEYTERAYPNMSIQGAYNAILPGIEHIQWLLKRTVPCRACQNSITDDCERCQGSGLEPRLYIHRENCATLCGEMRAYRWPEESERKNAEDPKRRPLKRRDHGPDALRYMVMSAGERKTRTRAAEYDRLQAARSKGVQVASR